MAKIYEGKLLAEGLKFGLVVARFNEFITGKLLTGCIDALTRHGADEDSIDIVWVPGAFEIPLAPILNMWQLRLPRAWPRLPCNRPNRLSTG